MIASPWFDPQRTDRNRSMSRFCIPGNKRSAADEALEAVLSGVAEYDLIVLEDLS